MDEAGATYRESRLVCADVRYIRTYMGRTKTVLHQVVWVLGTIEEYGHVNIFCKRQLFNKRVTLKSWKEGGQLGLHAHTHPAILSH